MLTTITLSNEHLQFQHAMYKEHVIDTDLNRGLHQKYECLDFKFQGFFLQLQQQWRSKKGKLRYFILGQPDSTYY